MSSPLSAPSRTNEQEVTEQLRGNGVRVVSSDIYKELTLTFNPQIPLNESFLRFIQGLPDELKGIIALVPIKGDASADELATLLNEKRPAGVAIQGEDSVAVGRTRKGDRWVLMLEGLPGSKDQKRQTLSNEMPNGLTWMEPADLYVAIALSLASGHSFPDTRLRTAYPSWIAGCEGGKAIVRKVLPSLLNEDLDAAVRKLI